MPNIARGWSAVVGEASVLVAEITVLEFGYVLWLGGGFFGLVVSCQLLAGHWGKVQGVCSPRQAPVPYWTWRQARAGCLRPLSCLPLGLVLSDGLLHHLGCFSEALGWGTAALPCKQSSWPGRSTAFCPKWQCPAAGSGLPLLIFLLKAVFHWAFEQLKMGRMRLAAALNRLQFVSSQRGFAACNMVAGFLEAVLLPPPCLQVPSSCACCCSLSLGGC